MFCKKCGKEIDDSAVICPNCGCATDNYAERKVVKKEKGSSLVGWSIASLVLAFVAPLFGLVIGMGFKPIAIKDNNWKAAKLCIAAICLSVLSLGILFYVMYFELINIENGINMIDYYISKIYRYLYW
ncbi:MAG: zinc-ribbon domain-containing protein [Christensenellales bacterium]